MNNFADSLNTPTEFLGAAAIKFGMALDVFANNGLQPVPVYATLDYTFRGTLHYLAPSIKDAEFIEDLYLEIIKLSVRLKYPTTGFELAPQFFNIVDDACGFLYAEFFRSETNENALTIANGIVNVMVTDSNGTLSTQLVEPLGLAIGMVMQVIHNSDSLSAVERSEVTQYGALLASNWVALTLSPIRNLCPC